MIRLGFFTRNNAKYCCFLIVSNLILMGNISCFCPCVTSMTPNLSTQAVSSHYHVCVVTILTQVFLKHQMYMVLHLQREYAQWQNC